MTTGGSILSLSINGVPYNVAADSDFTITPPFTVEADPHSGGNSRIVMFADGHVEGIEVICDGVDYQNLLDIADPKATPGNVPISFKESDGTVYTADGWIHAENRTTQKARLTLTLFPANRRWEVFSP